MRETRRSAPERRDPCSTAAAATGAARRKDRVGLGGACRMYRNSAIADRRSAPYRAVATSTPTRQPKKDIHPMPSGTARGPASISDQFRDLQMPHRLFDCVRLTREQGREVCPTSATIPGSSTGASRRQPQATLTMMAIRLSIRIATHHVPHRRRCSPLPDVRKEELLVRHQKLAASLLLDDVERSLLLHEPTSPRPWTPTRRRRSPTWSAAAAPGRCPAEPAACCCCRRATVPLAQPASTWSSTTTRRSTGSAVLGCPSVATLAAGPAAVRILLAEP